MNIETFKLLETKLKRILTHYERLRSERDTLCRELEERQRQVKELEGKLKLCERERAEVRARVEKVLGRVESLEASWGSA